MFASVCFYSKFVKILIGRIPGVIITYVASILEKMVEEFWQNTFVPCRDVQICEHAGDIHKLSLRFLRY